MADGVAGTLLRSRALLAACLFVTSPVHASCFASPDPAIRQLQLLVYQDGRKALQQSQETLDALVADPAATPAHIASLYAVQARSYSILELDGEARNAALKGLDLAPSPTDPVHLDLLSTHAENIYEQDGLSDANQAIESARAAQAPGSLADLCLLITLGRLQFRQDRADLAILNLTHAYRSSTTPARAEQRMLAADVLSSVMREMGDNAQALALNQEAIDWDTAHNASLHLSVSRFLRGSIFMAMREYERAIGELAQARQLSVLLRDDQGIAFADLNTCESQIELGRLDAASQQCATALRLFTATGAMDMVKDTQTLLAQIDFARGHAARALDTLNKAFDQSGMSPRRVAKVYRLRARTNAALHHYRDAYDDLDKYVQRYETVNAAERDRQVTALRARFETDRAIERAALLKRELGLAQELADRRQEQLRWTATLSISSVLVIALLVYILIANQRHRRQLVTLASQDALTGLPNRRCTAELATGALRAAFAAQTPLTLAVIDLDRFKAINDQCGHAAGDYVLKEFARRSRDSLRTQDIFGRWGGEEFLLVMPATSLEMGLTVMERLREVAIEIQLPPPCADTRVSLSAGLALVDEHTKSLDELIASADRALYEAKEQGRDLVRVADAGHRAGISGIWRAMGSQAARDGASAHAHTFRKK